MKKIIVLLFLIVLFNPIYIIEGGKAEYIKQHSSTIDPDKLLSTIRNAIKGTEMAGDKIVFDGSALDIEAAILGLVYIESTFKPEAVNPRSGCTGLMQLEKATYLSMVRQGLISSNKWDNIKDPYYNVMIGVLWLDYTYKLVKKALPGRNTSDIFKVTLAAYNKGVTTTLREIRSTGIPSKYRYVSKFTRAYRIAKG